MRLIKLLLIGLTFCVFFQAALSESHLPPFLRNLAGGPLSSTSASPRGSPVNSPRRYSEGDIPEEDDDGEGDFDDDDEMYEEMEAQDLRIEKEQVKDEKKEDDEEAGDRNDKNVYQVNENCQVKESEELIQSKPNDDNITADTSNTK